MNLFDSTIQNLQKGLDYSSVKNQTIGHNIANVDTPNYKAKQVSFKDHLESAGLEAKRSNDRHLPFSNADRPYSVTARQDVTYNNNGNSVDIDREMSELAKNQLYYEALTERINGKFNSIKSVVGGR
ncbi:flagellar basal body rod protein FlgB [Alkalibacillus haloalkaliphilus]|uniref:flagellar basal body rod protein FlgB n=1 Tax=Alkalibacillus haloalkaliphilus TaxID=94136 RepID=UPI0029367E22|nr:flagellar basal body rod protein FlgB [Alkalibacillus haloalkaliphilus]MDV2580594.1 flagellar basal body rod protein FlgB [Alkalibacillus haloalkaliphilus]